MRKRAVPCEARPSGRSAQSIPGVAADLDQLQRLYIDWLDKLGPLLSGPEPTAPRSLRH